jgi:T5SS/PEP-CTERM-associated repeat protein
MFRGRSAGAVRYLAPTLGLMAGVAPACATVIDGGTTVTVPGTFASPWYGGWPLTVGNTSAGGTLIISNGGGVTSGGTGLIPPPDALDIAVAPGSVGETIVTGAGSSYSAAGLTGEIHVGSDTCTATLEVLNGATFTNAGGYGLRSWCWRLQPTKET